jgi:hypothetical protein
MTRMRLPNRRPAETFDLQAGGLRYTCTIGRFPDGRLAEIFFWPTTGATATPTLPRVTAPLCARSPCSTALIPRLSDADSVAMPMAERAVRSASRSISSSARKDRKLVR